MRRLILDARPPLRRSWGSPRWNRNRGRLSRQASEQGRHGNANGLEEVGLLEVAASSISNYLKCDPAARASRPHPEAWVKSRSSGKKKRLTFAIAPELHARMKVACARRGVSMVAELEAMLEERYPPEKP